MTAPALLIPRPEIDILDKNGKADRNWYKYWALLGKATGPSTTFSDDIQIRDILGGLQPIPLTQAQLGQAFYPQSDAERAANVGPANYAYPAGNLLRYGADASGTRDSTVAIQAAIKAGPNVYVPAGIYIISATLTITSSVWLCGAGRANTVIEWQAATTLLGVSIACDTAVMVTGITFSAVGAAVSGRMIQVAGGATHNGFSVFRDNAFIGGFSQLYCISAYALVVDSNYFSGFVQSGLHIENQFQPDAGDSTVIANIFAGSPDTTSSVCIEQFSSGGLKILGNKLNTGAFNYRCAMSSGISTSDLVINGNSMENAAIKAIALGSAGGGATWANIDISGNQIALVPVGIEIATSYGAFSGVVIGNNRISLLASATEAISIDYTSGFNISGNVLASTGGTPVGITIDANSSGNVGVNTYSGSWNPKLSNGSGAVYVLPQSLSTGTAAITCSTVYGPIYEGSTAVTFASAFDSAPTVECDPGTIGGGISATASTITKTGCTIVALSVTNGGAGNATYRARGII